MIEPAGGMVVAIGVVGRCLPRLATWLTQYDDRLLRHGWQVGIGERMFRLFWIECDVGLDSHWLP